MKIISIIRNYRNDADPTESEPDWIVAPDSVMLRSGKPLFLPSLEEEYRLIPSLALKCGRLGKSIRPKFAHRYIAEMAPAVQVMPLRAVEAIARGENPRQSDVVFDGSVMIGDFIPADSLNITLSLSSDLQEEAYLWESSKIIMNPYETLALVSSLNTIKTGDIILAALSLPGITAKPDSKVKCLMEEDCLLNFKVK